MFKILKRWKSTSLSFTSLLTLEKKRLQFLHGKKIIKTTESKFWGENI